MKIGVLLYMLVYLIVLRAGILLDITTGRPIWFFVFIDGPQILAAMGMLFYGLNINSDFISFVWKMVTPAIALSFIVSLCMVMTGTSPVMAKVLTFVLTIPLVVIPTVRINYLTSCYSEQ